MGMKFLIDWAQKWQINHKKNNQMDILLLLTQ